MFELFFLKICQCPYFVTRCTAHQYYLWSL